MYRIRKTLGLGKIGPARLPPQHVAIRRVSEAAGDRVVEASARGDPVEAFRRPLAGDERTVALIDVAGQELRRLGIGAAQQHGRYPLDIGGEPGGIQGPDVLADRHQHLAAEMTTFLFRSELVLEMHAGSARLDHRLHQFVGVERAAEAGFGIGNDRRHIINAVIALGMSDLIGAAQRVVDAPDDSRDRIHRVQRLVRIHLPRCVRIRRNLPAGEIDRLQSGFDLLHRLVAGQCAQRRDKWLGVEQMP